MQRQKAPVNKLVRVDSSNPAGRLHAFLHKKDTKLSDGDRDLAATRYYVVLLSTLNPWTISEASMFPRRIISYIIATEH